MTKLEELKAAFEATPQGEWRYDADLSAVVYIDKYQVKAAADFGKIDNPDTKAPFIVLAHNMMPQLLEAVELAKAASRIIESEYPEDDDRYETKRKIDALLERFK